MSFADHAAAQSAIARLISATAGSAATPGVSFVTLFVALAAGVVVTMLVLATEAVFGAGLAITTGTGVGTVGAAGLTLPLAPVLISSRTSENLVCVAALAPSSYSALSYAWLAIFA